MPTNELNVGRWAIGGAQLPRGLGDDCQSAGSSPARSSGRPPRPPPLGALSGSATRSRRQGGPSESSGRGLSSSQAAAAPQPQHPLLTDPDGDGERAEASTPPARLGTPRSSWGRHSWSGSGQTHDTQLPEAAASAMGYSTGWREASTPEQSTSLHRWPADRAAACSSDNDEEGQPLFRGMLEAGRGGQSSTSGASGSGSAGLAGAGAGAGMGSREPPSSTPGRSRLPPFPAAAAASAGRWPLGCGASLLSQPQRELLRWLWRAVLRPFWPAPVAALAFALGVRALGYWGSVMPGTQAVFIMCWVQCCFGVLSRQGRRTALRLAQLAAALVGVLVLLPRHSAYSSGELGLRFGVPSGYDEDGGVDGDLPALSAWGAGDWSWGGLLGLLGVDMGSLSDGSSSSGGGGMGAAGAAAAGSGLRGGAGAGAAAGVESLAELELHRALMRVQVALGVVLGLWLLQAAVACVVLPAAVAATATAANSAAAAAGGSACGSPAGSPQYAAAAAATGVATAGGVSGAGGLTLKALGAMTPHKSHLDLPALDGYEALQAAGGLGTVFGRWEGSGTSAAWEVLRSYGTSGGVGGGAGAGGAGGGGCVVCSGPPAPPSSGGVTLRPPASRIGAGLPQGSPGMSGLQAKSAGPKGGCCAGAGGVGVGSLQHQQAAALAAALVTQRLLMWVAVVAQLVAAAALTGMWGVPTDRVELSHGVVLLSVSRDSDNKRWLYGGPGRSWLALLTLAAAMAAPLPLPDLLRSRHAVLWHTALLLRPAASRPLGLRLLDCNAAKLMTGVAVGLLFASWAAAVFSWQLLQVATLVGGLAKLYLDGVRQQVRHGPASGLGCPGVSAIINGPALLGVGSGSSHHVGNGGGYVVQLSGGGVGGACHGAGASVGNGNGTGSSCYVGAVREATSAAAIVTGLCPNGNGNGQHNGGIGGMVSGGANGCNGAANGHGTLLNGCASSADAPCSPTAAGSSGGSKKGVWSGVWGFGQTLVKRWLVKV